MKNLKEMRKMENLEKTVWGYPINENSFPWNKWCRSHNDQILIGINDRGSNMKCGDVLYVFDTNRIIAVAIIVESNLSNTNILNGNEKQMFEFFQTNGLAYNHFKNDYDDLKACKHIHRVQIIKYVNNKKLTIENLENYGCKLNNYKNRRSIFVLSNDKKKTLLTYIEQVLNSPNNYWVGPINENIFDLVGYAKSNNGMFPYSHKRRRVEENDVMVLHNQTRVVAVAQCVSEKEKFQNKLNNMKSFYNKEKDFEEFKKSEHVMFKVLKYMDDCEITVGELKVNGYKPQLGIIHFDENLLKLLAFKLLK